MSLFYEHHFRLNGLDIDGHGMCKASALLNHLQDTATLAAEGRWLPPGDADGAVRGLLDAGPVLVPAGPAPAVRGPADCPHLAPGG